MRKIAALIVLTLVFGIGTSAKPHPHHQEALQGKVGNASDTDAWRDYLLVVGTPSGYRGEEGDLTILTIARKFRAEFEKAIDDFNEAQERRTEADQIAALTSFIAQRDAMVQAYKNELLSKLARGEGNISVAAIEAQRPVIRSATTDPTTGEGCGIPKSISCSITYSRFNTGKTSADGTFYMGITQILDGAAIMAGDQSRSVCLIRG
jgi:hypothetical protein